MKTIGLLVAITLSTFTGRARADMPRVPDRTEQPFECTIDDDGVEHCPDVEPEPRCDPDACPRNLPEPGDIVDDISLVHRTAM
ncbi:MAG TPA: hypothetical protein VL463_27700 [Kofleriaceae bacterium]|nr:hypothetical protein [Kofleriaceae bacterium]